MLDIFFYQCRDSVIILLNRPLFTAQAGPGERGGERHFINAVTSQTYTVAP